jgi:UDP-2-acetamido-3-amino-2,3-dideoxy-glucuronate N-acetyltransferase
VPDLKYFIHPTAIVDEGCHIGNGTSIWHFSHLMADSKIGEDCSLGQNVFIGRHVVIGNRVKVQNNVSVYEGVTCEEDVFVGPSVVFTNVINPRSAIDRKNEFQKTIVRRGASIGANSTIICGIEIGEYAFIGAGSVVTKSVLPYALVRGNPAIQAGWMSQYGNRLAFDNDGKATCQSSNDNYVLKNGKVTKLQV